MTNACSSIVGLTICLLLCGCRRSEQPSGQIAPATKAANPPQAVATKVAKPRRAGDTKTVDLAGGVKLELVWCPPGAFTMGSPADEEGRFPNEKQHKVTLTKGFWLGKHEVTQRQWQSVMGDNPSYFKNAGHRLPQPILVLSLVEWK